MKKQIFLLISVLFAAAFAQAQNKYAYYFDKDLNLSNKSSHAVFVGEGAYQNGSFELKVFDKKEKKLLLIEHFTDSSLQQSNGLFVSYLPNGNKEMEGVYKMDKKDGLWKEWNWKGQLEDSIIYSDGTRKAESSYSYYPGGKLLSLSIYKNDSLVKLANYDENGKELPTPNHEDLDKVFTKAEVEAAFPGGPAAWSSYISRAIMLHVDEFKQSDYGTCIIRFIVDKNGTVHDVAVINSCGNLLGKIGVDAIKNGPKWIPAQQNGHYVNAYRLQPITLQNPDE
jgi:hypothetical protein